MEQRLFPKSEVYFPQEFAYVNSKKIRKYFQKQQDKESKLHLIKIVQEYSKCNNYNDIVPYVLTNVLNQIDSLEKKNESYETALQFLIMLSMEPNYLLHLVAISSERHNKVRIKKVRQFKSRAFAIYRSLDTFMDSLRITLMFIERGTKELNRDPTVSEKGREALCSLEKSDLINELKICLTAYYWELKQYGVILESTPSVNERLILHCLQKKWLLPISNVILIRDAQYQMMGKNKYKKEELLSEDALPFLIDSSLPYDKRVKCAKTTYRYALRIKAIISDFIEKFGGSQSVQAKMITHFRSKSKNPEQDQINKLLGIPSFSNPYKDKLMVLYDFDPGIFDVPILDKTKLSLKLSQIFDLSPQQFFDLRNELPVMLLERGRHFDIPKEMASTEEQEDYRKILTAFSYFVNPDNFINQDGNGVENIQRDLKNAASIIERYNKKIDYDKQNIEKSFDIIHKYIDFKDLTLPCLFLSKALEIDYIDQFDFKGFPNKFTKCISNNLIKYQKKTHIGTLSGLTQLNRDILFHVANDEVFQRKRDSIKGFLQKNDWQHFLLFEYPLIVKHPENNAFSSKIRDVVNVHDCTPAYQDHFVYTVYFQMMNSYLRELKIKITKTVIGHYVEIARNDVKSFLSR